MKHLKLFENFLKENFDFNSEEFLNIRSLILTFEPINIELALNLFKGVFGYENFSLLYSYNKNHFRNADDFLEDLYELIIPSDRDKIKIIFAHCDKQCYRWFVIAQTPKGLEFCEIEDREPRQGDQDYGNYTKEDYLYDLNDFGKIPTQNILRDLKGIEKEYLLIKIYK